MQERVYYDSRHTIPVAWWFLFEPPDVLRIERELPDQCGRLQRVQYVRFRVERERAIDRFVSRRQYLTSLVRGRVEPRHVDFFVAILQAWSGRYLVMNPNEILQRSVEEDLAVVAKIVEIASTPKPDMEAFVTSFSYVCAVPAESDDADARQVKVLGFTYGDLANRLWRRVVEGIDDSPGAARYS